MWPTSRGNRTLQGAEASLVAAAVDALIDELTIGLNESGEEGPECLFCSGVPLFDSLTSPQRIGLLHRVARDLLTDATPNGDPSAAAEATVAAIFECLRDQIEIEIFWEIEFSLDRSRLPADQSPLSGHFGWRRRTLAALRELDAAECHAEPFLESPPLSSDRQWWMEEPNEDEPPQLPAASCTDTDRWGFWLEILTDAILWDRDFEMAGDFLDADPRLARRQRQCLGIKDDYFIQVAPDPLPDELPLLISEIRGLVRGKPR